VRPLEVTGAQAESRCDLAGITLNKNAIPFDPAPPMTASGIRIGSPSVTTQGMAEPEMAEIARLIGRAVRVDPTTPQGKAELAEVSAAVTTMVAAKPAYPRG
jgi:glycine hydroxymethyltransferase